MVVLTLSLSALKALYLIVHAVVDIQQPVGTDATITLWSKEF